MGFVDGHLQLMRLHPQVGSWSNFVKFQFIKPLKMLLDAGCPRVVLCFDCYDNVPAYKNMTQTSRVSKHVVRPFAEGQELPEHIPEDPMSCLMNRRFKLKLIEMLCKQVPIMMKLMPGKKHTLDVDFVFFDTFLTQVVGLIKHHAFVHFLANYINLFFGSRANSHD